jgi:hypothetical protein
MEEEMAVNPVTGTDCSKLSSALLRILLCDMDRCIEGAKDKPLAKHLPVDGWKRSKQMIEEELKRREET